MFAELRVDQDECSTALFSPLVETQRGDLLSRYNALFKTTAANNAELTRIAQRIRYQVYCVENAFEDVADHPLGLERDEFDSHSVHALLADRFTGLAFGTVRLILPRDEDPERSFALQRVCAPCAKKSNSLFPLCSTVEVSRFSISRRLRLYQPNPQQTEDIFLLAPDRRSTLLMRLGLIQSIIRMSIEQRITHWCAAMEPQLLRLLAASGIHFEPMGPLVAYHGLRQPCYCNVVEMLQRVKVERPSFWDVLTERGTLYEQLLRVH